MLSDRRRHDLFVALQQHLGPEPADTLMELLPPMGWGDVAHQADMVARFDQMDARFRTMDAKFDQMDAKFDRMMARFEKVDARFDRVDARFEQVGTRLDAKIDRQFARMVWANLAMLIATVGLVTAVIAVSR